MCGPWRLLAILILACGCLQPAWADKDLHGDPMPPGAIVRLGTIRFRHRGFRGTGLAFSRNGKMLVAGGEGNVLRAWEAATGRLLHEIPFGEFNLSGMALCPDDKHAAVGGYTAKKDNQPATYGIRFVEIATGKVQRTLSRKGGMDFCALAFTPDGKHLPRWRRMASCVSRR